VSEIPPITDQPDAPKIGVDSWVATSEERVERARGARGLALGAFERTPPPFRLAAFVAIACTLPLFVSSGNLFRYGFFTLVYVMLGLGLNVVVGFSGLLDLGYVAFYGIGAYTYAILSSDLHGIHWPAEVTIPIAIVVAAVLGLILGLSSRRLLGDYLAIVTLFFGQAFVTFVNNANPKGLTGGANGIGNIDNISIFGYTLTTTRQYYYFMLAAFVVVFATLWSLVRSRIGRAWMALREDALAASLMSIPVNRLKLLAFVFGAGIAGLTGAIVGPALTGVAPGNFDTSILITIYAVVILGGAGSLAGVVIGAIVINVSYELLTPATPDRARWLFYGVLIVALVAKVRPWSRLVTVLVTTAVLGFALHELAAVSSSTATTGEANTAGFLTGAIQSWVVIPESPGRLPDYGYVLLIAMILVLTTVKGWWRVALLAPTLYLAAFVWENLLIEQPSVTRLILFGALLVALMNLRPQGLLGTARVEIV
jgi:branched-chain amino acid transport system permease protein